MQSSKISPYMHKHTKYTRMQIQFPNSSATLVQRLHLRDRCIPEQLGGRVSPQNNGAGGGRIRLDCYGTTITLEAMS